MQVLRLSLIVAFIGLLCILWRGSNTLQERQNTQSFSKPTAPFSLTYKKQTSLQPEPHQQDSPVKNIAPAGFPSDVTRYYGLCDASAAVALDAETFIVGDDEDNVLRVYKRAAGGQPISSLDLSDFLQVDPKEPEVDIEGGDRLGDRIYWISSHGRNVKGKEAPSRQRFFATTVFVSNGVVTLKPFGQPYSNLLRDLIEEPRLKPFNLTQAAGFAPKSPGALNIEGLASTPEGHLLIGFRNPIPQGRALIVPLLNPHELIEGSPARFGDPVLLDLDARGIRSMTFWLGQYFIVAGSSDQSGHSRFYLWDTTSAPQQLKGLVPGGLNPEAVAFWDELGMERLYIVSDDGTEPVLGKECKKLKNSAWKQFRAVCLNPSADVAQVP